MNYIKRNFRIIIPITIVIILGVAVSILPFWSDIDITLHGIQAQIGDEEDIGEKTVTIRGRYWRYLFLNDRFEGRIEVEGYDFTFDGRMWPVELSFEDSRNGRSSVLSYWGYDGRNFIDGAAWRIYSKPDFSKILLLIFNDSENMLYISAPADSREEAVDIAKELASDFKWE